MLNTVELGCIILIPMLFYLYYLCNKSMRVIREVDVVVVVEHSSSESFIL
jgi:hypothetical protein